MTTLAERLIEAREDLGWKKSDLRRAAKIKSASTLTEIESGKRTESPQLPTIASALGVSVLWLQHGRGSKYANTINSTARRIEEPASLPAMVTVLKPPGERETWLTELNSLAGQLDTLRLGMLIKTARDLVAEQPAKQTPKSSV